MTRPLVSVCLTTYNSDAKFLRKAAHSVLTQSFHDLELIVGDNSPTDSLRSIFDSFGDSRIKYRHNIPTLSRAGNMHSVLYRASGRYAALMCHDDYYHHQFLERLIAPMEADTKTALTFCNRFHVDRDDKECIGYSSKNAHYWMAGPNTNKYLAYSPQLIVQRTITPINCLMRLQKQYLEPREDMDMMYGDWYISRLSAQNTKAFCVAEPLVYYRVHDASYTLSPGLHHLTGAFGEVSFWKSLLDSPTFDKCKSACTSGYADALNRAAGLLYSNNQKVNCAKCAIRSLSARLTPRAVALLFATILPRQLVSAIKPRASWKNNASVHGTTR